MIINSRRNIRRWIDKYKLNKKIKSLKKDLNAKLSLNEKKEIIEFYSKYVKKISLDWHEYYKNYLPFDKRNIPEDLCFNYIIPKLNNPQLRIAYSDKNMYDKLYPNFKKPKTYLRNIEGNYLNENYEIETLDRILREIPSGNYIIKNTMGTYGGQGIKEIKKNENNYYINEDKVNIEEILNEYNRNFIFQEKITQNLVLSKLHKNSLNTIRIVSYRKEKKIKILSAVLRMGSNGSVVDNPMSSGGCTVGINLDTGITKDIAVDRESKIIKDLHPYTKVKFSNIKIPNFEKLKEVIKDYHLQVPHYFDLISWDIGINEKDEFYFIEMNLGAQEINFHQKTNGSLFGDLTEEVLERVFLRKD